MQAIYSPKHKLRNSKTELCGGELVTPFEIPQRAEYVLEEFNKRNMGKVLGPLDFGMAPLLKVHDSKYLDFIQSCYMEWQMAGNSGEAIAWCWPSRGDNNSLPPNDIDAKLGYYCLSSDTSICKGTWEASLDSANVALTGAHLMIDKGCSSFSICRPPGHHATRDMFGGYCFINNAAVACQYFLDNGSSRVAILDVDFHHCNGTQSIFYNRNDVMVCSIHGEPQNAFPYFSGYEEETGYGDGEGFNFNYPLPPNTGYSVWKEALNSAIEIIRNYNPDKLIVSLGSDTFKDDPISFFKLESEDFFDYGKSIASLGMPALFVMEGGYAVDDIGTNMINVLQGFET